MFQESTDGLELFKKQYRTDASIGDLAPTVCRLCGLPAPDRNGGTPIAEVVDHAGKLMDGEGLTEKVLLFCADALGESQRKHYTADFEKIQRTAGLRILSSAVMPSVTPVCYGTIFTGASPAVHGIQQYEKPVIKIETLFDVFAKNGKNVAIAAVNGCSIDKIFRERAIDYYSFRTDEKSFRCARELMAHSDYDLIVCYMTGYDAVMHKTGPFSEAAAGQAQLAAERFVQLAEDMDIHWRKFHRVLAFVPDHGGHAVDETHGAHGSNIPEDMLVNHYYRIRSREPK
ncbi:MAG: Type I phosphodiesterase / nucleotide pyrophosphatase [Lentisphaerae bacterium ADurb.Bin242]|nr:MAG: Type I phosphodiesterase / nucleotide pyrophosphatase [Lentisphaerae bacterium ADurb.Bin242]